MSHSTSAVTTEVLANAAAPAVASLHSAPTLVPNGGDAHPPAVAAGPVATRRRRRSVVIATAAAVTVSLLASAFWWWPREAPETLPPGDPGPVTSADPDRDEADPSPAGSQIGDPLTGHTSAVESVAVGQWDGTPIVVSAGGFDATIRIWDLATGEPIGDPLASGPIDAYLSVALGEVGGTPVVVSGGTRGVQVWDLAAGGLMDVPIDSPASVSSVAVGELDGVPVAVSGGWDSTVRVWDLTTGDQIGDAITAQAGPVGPTPDLLVDVGERNGVPVAVSTGGVVDRALRVWDLTTGEQVGEPLTGHAVGVSAVAVGELDGVPIAVSGGWDDTVRVWDLTSGEQLGGPLSGHAGVVTSVAIGEVDGAPVVVSGSEDRTLRVWDLASGQQLGRPLSGHAGVVTSVAIGELDGAPIAVSGGGGTDSTVRVWRLPPVDGTG